jgi:type IV secretory pathway VirD2 relaxase
MCVLLADGLLCPFLSTTRETAKGRLLFPHRTYLGKKKRKLQNTHTHTHIVFSVLST